MIVPMDTSSLMATVGARVQEAGSDITMRSSVVWGLLTRNILAIT